MSEEDLERYESDVELQIYREYRDVAAMFRYVVETERRFYMANKVELNTREGHGSVFFEILLEDAWVWDMYRPARFLKKVRVLTFRDVNVEELEHPRFEPPGDFGIEEFEEPGSESPGGPLRGHHEDPGATPPRNSPIGERGHPEPRLPGDT